MHRRANFVAVLAACLPGAATGWAQYPGQGGGAQYGNNPYTRPPVISPFLNLNRGGDAAINYYGLVRQQINVNRALQRFGNDVNFLEAAAQASQEQLETGHPTLFGSHSPYFMNQQPYFNNSSAGGRPPGQRPVAGPAQKAAPAR